LSRETVEVIREIYRRYRADPESALELIDPQIVWIEPPEIPDSEVFHGHDGLRRSLRKFVGTWENFQLDVTELVEAGDDVLARTRLTGAGKGSGVQVEEDQFVVWTVRDGKAVKLQMFFDRGEAERAAGLVNASAGNEQR
jgi:ketosteroid isomerase-like protein